MRKSVCSIGVVIALSAVCLAALPGSRPSGARPQTPAHMAAPAAGPSDQATGSIILDTCGFWRVFYTLNSPVYGEGKAIQKLASYCVTPAPPNGWNSPGFDDSSWNRLSGAPFPSFWSSYADCCKLQVGFTNTDASSPCLSLICMRGKFSVADPKVVKGLKLSLSYRGGAVVYLNGKQVAKGNISDAAITDQSLAEEYPSEAYFKVDGSLLTGDRGEKDAQVKERWLSRTRKLENIAIPSDLLRPGVNVLAIEVHRAPYSAAFINKVKLLKGPEQMNAMWSTCGLVTARLTADSPLGLTPNVVRPKGLQVWNSNLQAADFDLDFGDVNEPLGPMQIVGTPGGSFSAKVIVGSDKAISGLKVSAGDLAGPSGKMIPASAIRLRYALPNAGDDSAEGRYASAASMFDALAETPPADIPVRTSQKQTGNWVRPGQPAIIFGAVLPVYLTVSVPADASPGQYKGKLTVTAAGEKPAEVPVDLKVCSFRLPPPSQFDTLVDFIQSPESVAMYYNVPLYSDEHFKRMEKSFDLLGELGNWTLYIPLVCNTNQGNSQTMVRWLKQPDGTYKHDFSVMEKYLNLAVKHMGKPRMICLYIWDTRHGGGYSGDRANEPVPVSQLDASGQVSVLELPKYSSDEHQKLWKPVADGIMERLKARGLEKTAVIGLANDGAPDAAFVATCSKLFPGIPWMRHGHSSRPNISGVPIAYQCLVWTPRFPDDPDKSRSYGWMAKENWGLFCRSQAAYPNPIARLIGEMNIAGSQRGFGRIGLHFWPVLEDKKGKKTGTIQARYPQNSWENLDWMIKAFVPPGPDGAMDTARLELMREGLQECQARIFIEKALTDPAAKVKLGEDLVKRAQSILDDRTRTMLIALDNHFNCGLGARSTVTSSWWDSPGQVGKFWYQESGWQDRSAKLYEMAGEVAKALGKQ